MNTIVLHGPLEKFGGPFSLAVTTAAEAVHALCSLLPGFSEEIRKGSWRVVRGKPGARGARDLGEGELRMRLGGEMHLMVPPSGSGGKNGGTVKTVVGVVLLVAAIYFSGGTAAGMAGQVAASSSFAGLGVGMTYGTVALLGLTMALQGVSLMLSPQAKASSNAAQDTAQSYLFNGQINSPDQGGPVPLAFGRCRTGSVIISLAVETQDIPV
jgi:predicted phage tail protein